MASSDPLKSELFNLTVLDLPDQAELVLCVKYQYLQSILAKVPRAERIIHLTQIASSSVEKYRDINDAFLYGILALETRESTECFQLLHSIMQDQWEVLCYQCRYFSYSKFSSLKTGPKSRLLWLVDKLAALQAPGSENLFLGLLRQIKSGDYSIENTEFIKKLFQTFSNHKNWFLQQSQLIPYTIYSFLRIISGNGIDLGLRKDMAVFCSNIIIERFKECSVIGRDLIRILQEVSRMSEFDQVWTFLNQKSSSTGRGMTSEESSSTELRKLLKVPSQKRFLSARLSPDMELNLLFILNTVKYGTNHRRYYEWLSQEYLKVTDSDNLLVDIIRYLIVAYHPPNSVLASSSVQRWQIITWFLRQMKSNYSTANAKLALFYDWLFYDPEVDNIMNIEPAILIITKSASVNPKISCTMLEFLYLLRQDYKCYNLSIDKGIDRSMLDILSKRVISNLESILLADQIDESIKDQTKDLFPCYLNLINPSKNPSIYTDTLISTIKDFQQHFKDSNCTFNRARQVMSEIIAFISKLNLDEFEEIKMVLNDLVLEEFAGFNYSNNSWSDGLMSVLTDSNLDKDIIDLAIERISMLPQNSFDIEKFIMNERNSKSQTSTSILDTELSSLSDGLKSSSQSISFKASFDDDQMMNGVEDQMKRLKSMDPSIFYKSCFTQFGQELGESPNIIELLEIILEDTDPSQLFLLKNQLFLISKNPILSNWDNLIKSLPSTKDWDGYCQIFLWDLLLISLKQFPDFGRVRAGFKDILKILISNGLLKEDHSEICNGFLNMAISVKSVMSSNSCNEYFSWLVLLLEETDGVPHIILPILIYYWRSNSRLFLQSLVRIDEEVKQVNKIALKAGLSTFSKKISTLEDTSPAKKSLMSCLETTLALLK